MFTTRRMRNKTECFRFYAATLHCAHAAKDNFIAFLSYEIERLSFLGRPCRVSAFGAFPNLSLRNATRFEEEPNIACLSSEERPALCEHLKVITEHRLYLQCFFVNIWPSSWLGHE